MLRGSLFATARRAFSVSAAARAVKVGDVAPHFQLVNTQFKTVKLEDFLGKKTVFAFYPAAFSGSEKSGCELQLCSLKPIAEKGITVLGVSSDFVFAQKAWKAKLELPFELVSDHKLDMSMKYVGAIDLGTFLDKAGVSQHLGSYMASARGVVAIDERGKVIFTWVGKDENGALHPGKPVDMAGLKKALGI
eukprot:m.40636 g.40636  ORF g.40636 m.40636 type:complete len:191 (+) comp11913_c0_seq1:88-660(+)